jgi:hypothetical protein
MVFQFPFIIRSRERAGRVQESRLASHRAKTGLDPRLQSLLHPFKRLDARATRLGSAVLICVLVSAFPIRGETIFMWGNNADAAANSSIELTDGTGNSVVSVICVNRLVFDSHINFTKDLELDGFKVTVRFLAGTAEAPDTFLARPPSGYFADPESLTLQENQTGVIHIFPLSSS